MASMLAWTGLYQKEDSKAGKRICAPTVASTISDEDTEKPNVVNNPKALVDSLRRDNNKRFEEHALSIKEVYDSIHGQKKGCLVYDLQDIINKLKRDIDSQAAAYRLLQEELRAVQTEVYALRKQPGAAAPPAAANPKQLASLQDVPNRSLKEQPQHPRQVQDEKMANELSRHTFEIERLQQHQQRLMDQMKQISGVSGTDHLDIVKFKDMKDFLMRSEVPKLLQDGTLASQRHVELSLVKSGYLSLACIFANDRERSRIQQMLSAKEEGIIQGKEVDMGHAGGLLGRALAKTVALPPAAAPTGTVTSMLAPPRRLMQEEPETASLPALSMSDSSKDGGGPLSISTPSGRGEGPGRNPPGSSVRLESWQPGGEPERLVDSQFSATYDPHGNDPIYTYTIELHKSPDTPLGMSLSMETDAYIKVDGIGDGTTVDQWNRQHPSEAVQPGHGITAVNGIAGGSDNLVKAIQAANGLVKLTLHREPERLLRLGDPNRRTSG